MDRIDIDKKLEYLRTQFKENELAHLLGISRTSLFTKSKNNSFKKIEQSAINEAFDKFKDMKDYNAKFARNKLRVELYKSRILDDFLNKKDNNITRLAQKYGVSYSKVNSIIDAYFKMKMGDKTNEKTEE